MIDVIKTTNPFSKTDECLKIVNNQSNELAYNFGDILEENKSYTFSCWFKADSNLSINIYISDKQSQVYAISTKWTKIVFTATADISKSKKVLFSIPANKTLYAYEGMLELGNLPSDFKPNDKDVDNKIVTLQTNFEVQQGQINSLIKETTIVDDYGKSTSLKDKYFETVATVDGMKISIGDIQTSQDSMSSKITEFELTAGGLSTAVKEAQKTGDAAQTLATQTASKFEWIVKSGSSSTDFLLTDRIAQLVADNINLKGLVTFSGLNKDTQNKITETSDKIDSIKQASNLNNLIINGYGELGDNTNFSDWAYMGNSGQYDDIITFSQSDYGKTAWLGDALIPVNTLNEYTFSMNLKPDKDQTIYYLGFAEYDIDKQMINARFQLTTNCTYTTLEKDLKDGDTIVYLKDASSFIVPSDAPTWCLGLIFWNYKDSKGHLYEPGVYSRNSWSNLYDYTGVDKSTNTIKLKSAWSNGTIKAGTKVSQSNDGGYKYFILSYTNLNSDKWTHVEWKIKGQAGQFSSYPPEKFNNATKYIKFVLLPNYAGTENRITYLNSICLRDTTLSSSVSETYETKTNVSSKVNSAKNELNTKIDDIQVGGRNLILSSKTFDLPFVCVNCTPIKDVDDFYCTSVANEWSHYIYQDLDLVLNQIYTISLYAKSDTPVNLEIKDDSKNNYLLTEIKVDSKSWKLYIVTFVVKNTTDKPRITFLTRQNTSAIYIKKPKLEKGNKATDWSPAPEDKANQSIIDNWAKDSVVNGETVINGGYIKTNTIKTDQLAVDDIFATGSAVMYRINSQEINANRITSGLLSAERINAYGLSVLNKNTGQQTFNITNDGAVDIKGTVKSSNYNEGKTGWAINNDGTAEFNDIVARGSVITNDGGIVSSGGSGRNLIIGSHTIEQNYTYPSSNYIDAFAGVTSQKLNAETYTMSFWAKSTSAGDAIRVHFYNPSNIQSVVGSQGQVSGNTDGQCDFTLSTTFTKYWATFTIPKNSNATRSFIVPRLFSGAGKGTVSVKWEKLEEGTIATPWSPAPEDKLKQVRFWAGSSYEKREEAPFIVYSDGSLKATQGEYSGLWTGDIQVGNISISDKKANAGNDALLTIQNGENGIKKVQLTDGVSSSFAQDVIVTNNTYSTMISLKQDGSAYLSKGLNVADKATLNATSLIINNNTLTTTSSGGGFLFNNDLHVGSSNKSANLLIHGNASTDNITIDNTLYFGNLLKFTKNANGINIDFI